MKKRSAQIEIVDWAFEKRDFEEKVVNLVLSVVMVVVVVVVVVDLLLSWGNRTRRRPMLLLSVVGIGFVIASFVRWFCCY